MKKLVLTWLALAAVASAAGEVPDSLQPPAGEVVVAHVHGRGEQIYVREGDKAYRLQGPDAELLDDSGHHVGRHFAGPTWEWTDGSQVVGKVVHSVPSPQKDAVPWLLLEAKSHAGDGKLTHVTHVQRIHTVGGAAPTDGDAVVKVPYSADYLFYAPAP